MFISRCQKGNSFHEVSRLFYLGVMPVDFRDLWKCLYRKVHTPQPPGERQCRRIGQWEGQHLISEVWQVGMPSILCMGSGKEAGKLSWARTTFQYGVLYWAAVNIFIHLWGNLPSVEERVRREVGLKIEVSLLDLLWETRNCLWDLWSNTISSETR